jgi:uncharacterized membrane protein YphA (DoxX/SURF4 family)
MKTSSKRWVSAARYAQGGLFVLFGLNGFFHFLPQPPVPEAAGHFAMAMAATGYMFPLIKATEVVSGILLLSGRFVPLSLALIAPVLVNILAFHAFLAPSGLALPIVLLATELYLAWSYRDAFAPMLRAVVKPTTSRDSESSSSHRTDRVAA